MAENSVAEAISIYQRTGDSTLGSQLILHFEGLVFATCRTFYIDGQERDDLLQDEETLRRIWVLRNYISDMTPIEAMTDVRKRLENTLNNEEYLNSMNS